MVTTVIDVNLPGPDGNVPAALQLRNNIYRGLEVTTDMNQAILAETRLGYAAVQANNQYGVGAYGASQTHFGVLGRSASSTGVFGGITVEVDYLPAHPRAGTTGWSGVPAAPGVFGYNPSGGTGVAGLTDRDMSSGSVTIPADTGVFGHAISGTGVQAESDSGTALRAVTTRGTALRVEGPISLNAAGSATIPVGSASVRVTPPSGLRADSIVLATAQASPGKFYVSHVTKDVAAGSFTIVLSGKAAAALSVAWFVIG